MRVLRFVVYSRGKPQIIYKTYNRVAQITELLKGQSTKFNVSNILRPKKDNVTMNSINL